MSRGSLLFIFWGRFLDFPVHLPTLMPNKNTVYKWVQQYSEDPEQAFQGSGSNCFQMITRLLLLKVEQVKEINGVINIVYIRRTG
ncbi:hypothetical protein AXX12_04370 [Anaerosporomusa subterranea]|uniref:Uncharacterized protein n=1 Tax=Anaerosporomusa subterranea TaxID=1794912 RepID=A0A154BU14_ANASB|nr:hypothetical protein AXX12_04370 [Anaerosporomusa subterranea]MDF2502373.1 hypothetical protein [Anaerosporomusa subterranea]